MNLGEQRVFEAPQNLVDSAGHEQIDAQILHVHGDQHSQEEGVGVQLIHNRLGKKSQGVQKEKGKGWVTSTLVGRAVGKLKACLC